MLNALQLESIRSQFVAQASSALRLNPAEQEAAAEADPAIWALWSVSALSGDERVPYPYKDSLPKQLSDKGLPFFAGEVMFENGTALDFLKGALTAKIDAMYESKNPRVKQNFERFSQRAAMFLFAVGGALGFTSESWQKFMPIQPQTLIAADKKTGRASVYFDKSQSTFPIEIKPDRVVTFGPGLTGATFGGALIGLAQEVTYVSGGKSALFTKHWINTNLESTRQGIEVFRKSGTLQAQLPQGVDAKTARVPEARFRDDGIAAAMGLMSVKQLIDIAVMSSVHTAGPAECLAGIEGCSTRLRPGGLLVIKAPDISLGGEAGMDRIASRANDLFGRPVASGEAGTLSQHIDPSLPLGRAASFAIYQR